MTQKPMRRASSLGCQLESRSAAASIVTGDPVDHFVTEVRRGVFRGVRIRIASHNGQPRLSIRMEDARNGGINVAVRWLPEIIEALQAADAAAREAELYNRRGGAIARHLNRSGR